MNDDTAMATTRQRQDDEDGVEDDKEDDEDYDGLSLSNDQKVYLESNNSKIASLEEQLIRTPPVRHNTTPRTPVT